MNKQYKGNFRRDMKALLDTYGIRSIELTAWHDISSGRFVTATTHIGLWPSNADDAKNAEEELNRALLWEKMNRALESGDWDKCAAIHKQMYPDAANTLCVDCDERLDGATRKRCDKCGRLMCATCYVDGDGKCVECDMGGVDG